MGNKALLWMALGALLSGCPTVDLGDTPSEITTCNPAGGREYFDAFIWPDFIKPMDPVRGCTRVGCHIEGANEPAFRVAPLDLAFNYRAAQQQLNCGQPMASDLLTRPLAGIAGHGGGDLIQPGDPSIDIFLGWFEE